MKEAAIYVKHKPHLYFNTYTKAWVCSVESDYAKINGFGNSPEEAFDDLFNTLKDSEVYAIIYP